LNPVRGLVTGLRFAAESTNLPAVLPAVRLSASPIGELEPDEALIWSQVFDYSACNDNAVIEHLNLITGSDPIPVEDFERHSCDQAFLGSFGSEL
jgi:hypothetical protein